MNNEETQFEVFMTLMSTRAYPSTVEDAQTLEVETAFNTEQGREARILPAWKQYLAVLDQAKEPSQASWNEKRIDTLLELLEKMAWIVGYDFDKEKIRSTCTSSIPLDHFDEIQMNIRQEMIKMMQERYG